MPRLEQPAQSGALTSSVINTPNGTFTARFSTQGLAQLDFPGRRSFVCNAASSPDVSRSLSHWFEMTNAALLAMLSGRQPVEIPPLDVSAGTAFQQRVWSALREIPPGETRSYGEVAVAIGSPQATRAVGSACGANPIPLLIPCHRVLASGGKLGGFSGGMEWKKRLLAVEGVLSESAGQGELRLPAHRAG